MIPDNLKAVVIDADPIDSRLNPTFLEYSQLPMPLVLLPFFGSGFVPTDSMPTALRLFAEYQPFTPLIETIRGLLTGTAIGSSAAISAGWCVALSLAGYLWAVRLYNRDPSRP